MGRRRKNDASSSSSGPALARVEEGIRRAADGEDAPQKRFFRQRAHVNPLSFSQLYSYPLAPERMNWSDNFPAFAAGAAPVAERAERGSDSSASAAAAAAATAALPPLNGLRPGACVEVADVGCGFGGLLVGLAPVLPASLCLGLEIRGRVCEYVRLRVLALRKAHPGAYDNISVLNSNSMKHMLNFLRPGQLKKIFFCFPDPHFKRANHRRRIVSTPLLAEYAFLLRPGGLLYTITDVRDLHNWMAAHGDAHPFFSRVTDEELAADPCVAVMRTYTEEGKKVERLAGDKHVAVFRRLTDAEADAKAGLLDFWTEPPVAYEYIAAGLQAGSKLEHVPSMSRTKRARVEVEGPAAVAGAAATPSLSADAAVAAAAAAGGFEMNQT